MKIYNEIKQQGVEQEVIFTEKAENNLKIAALKEFSKKYIAMQEERTVLHKVISSAEVDGEPWLTVKCNYEVAKWLRKQKSSWHEHIDQQWNVYLDTFDISEELYLMLVLKFGK